MKEIQLTRGKVALVDDEDYEWVNQWNWYAMRGWSTFYAVRKGPRPRHEIIYLHRVIMDAPPRAEVDHINRNGLDCQRSNMRLSTKSENQHNSRLHSDSTSGYKGVSWNKASGKWQSRIRVNGKTIYLGHFDDPIEAAYAYDAVAKENYGEFARTNF